MIVVRITMQVFTEKLKEVSQTLLSLTTSREREPGCFGYSVLCDMKDKNLLCVIGEWENREKLDHYLN